MERMGRQEKRDHFKNSKNRHKLTFYFLFIGIIASVSLACFSKKREINTVSIDLTRLLADSSTIKIGAFKHTNTPKDPIPYHWKKNPGRYSKLTTSEKWWNTQLTFNTDSELFINESKDSILLPSSDSKTSSVQFQIPDKDYNLNLSIGFLPLSKFTKPKGKFRILKGTKVLLEILAENYLAEVWEDVDLKFESKENLIFEWESSNSIVALGNPILTESSLTKAPNIVFIVIDSARKDFFPLYGFPHPITPNLSSLSKDSVVFENPFSNGNWTKPSMLSFFHSEYSSNLGIHNLWFATLPNHKKIYYKNSSPSLTEILRQNAYFTETIMNNVFLLEYTTVGVDLGFHSSYQVGKDIDDSRVLTDKALNFLEKNKNQLFFLHWNLNTPHGGYSPPYEMMAAVRKFIPEKEFYSYPSQIRRYMAEIYYTDFLIGEFIQKLKNLKLYDDTIIVVTGDHGELFDEKHDYHFRYILQGIYGHGETHYDEEINVPLIIKPSANLNEKIKKDLIPGQQSLLSLVPTLLSLADISDENNNRKGEDYTQCIFSKDECPNEKFIYTEGRMSESIRTNQYKYIRRYQGYTNVSLTLEGDRHPMPEELYDLIEDPKEYNNLATQEIGKPLLEKARKDFDSGNFLTKNQFTIYLPDCGDPINQYRIFLSVPAGIYKMQLPEGFVATKDQLRSTLITGNRTEDNSLIKIHTVNPEPAVTASFLCNGKNINYRMGKWGLVSNSSMIGKENSLILSAREPNGFRKSTLPWIYNDGRLSGEYESENEALMGQEVRKILESWGYIHE